MTTRTRSRSPAPLPARSGRLCLPRSEPAHHNAPRSVPPQVWDLSAPPQANPLRSFEEHPREARGQRTPCLCAGVSPSSLVAETETSAVPSVVPAQVYSVAYNLVRRDCFVSASWDFTAKLWSLGHPHSLRTFEEHGSCLYCASWCGSSRRLGLTPPEHSSPHSQGMSQCFCPPHFILLPLAPPVARRRGDSPVPRSGNSPPV